jgi:hypothetical protein
VNENIFAFSATETGYNHTKIDKVCEDASDFYDDEKMHICVVADGHGSDNYPRADRGSKLAVDAAIKCTIDFVNTAKAEDVLTDEKHNYIMLLQLTKSILRTWHQSVDDDYAKRPFTEIELENVSDKYKKKYLAENESDRRIEKAYGCTLIMYVVTNEYSFGMQVGDGKCVIIDREGNFTEPIPCDENCQMNITTSLCDCDAIEEFRFFITDRMPTAVFCGSDGIDDSYANVEELYALYRSILKIFIEHGNEVGKGEIKEYLPVLTKRGSGDDVSIGLIMNAERVKNIAPVLEIQSEIFKLSEKLKEMKHQKDVTSEKDKSLSSKIKNWLDSGREYPKKMDDVIQVNELRISIKQLSEEIEAIERKIRNLNERQYGFVFENEDACSKVMEQEADNSVDMELQDVEDASEVIQEKKSCSEDIVFETAKMEEAANNVLNGQNQTTTKANETSEQRSLIEQSETIETSVTGQEEA